MKKGFDFALLKYWLGPLSRSSRRKKAKWKNYYKSIKKFYFYFYLQKYNYLKFKLNNLNNIHKVCNIWLNSPNIYNFEKNKIINSRILNYYINSKNFY